MQNLYENVMHVNEKLRRSKRKPSACLFWVISTIFTRSNYSQTLTLLFHSRALPDTADNESTASQLLLVENTTIQTVVTLNTCTSVPL